MIRRFFSKTIREAVAMRKHVERLLKAQRDLMKPEAVGAVQAKINELNTAIDANEDNGKIRIKTEELQFVAEKWIKSYPNPNWRENVEVLLVAIAVAMGIRTFFLQPFKIPTGSMQPTLYGVKSSPDFTEAVGYADKYGEGMSEEVRNLLQTNFNYQTQMQKDLVIPTGWQRVKEWFQGVSYLHIVAPADGAIDPNSFSPMQRFLIFNIKQSFTIGGVKQTMWFPPDFGESDLRHRAGIFASRVYHKGDDIVKMKIIAGDHLFVDRLTYNFRPPNRGDIVVFNTGGIPRLNEYQMMNHEDTNNFYIKRLCGLGGETIALKQNYDLVGGPHIFDIGRTTPIGHLVVNGESLSASTPHFENLYSFAGVGAGETTLAYHEDEYYGHAMVQELSPGQEVQIPIHHLFVMGDNTMNSLDSRYWGDFPANSVIGKSFFIYWPLSKRFGWGNE